MTTTTCYSGKNSVGQHRTPDRRVDTDLCLSFDRVLGEAFLLLGQENVRSSRLHGGTASRHQRHARGRNHRLFLRHVAGEKLERNTKSDGTESGEKAEVRGHCSFCAWPRDFCTCVPSVGNVLWPVNTLVTTWSLSRVGSLEKQNGTSGEGSSTQRKHSQAIDKTHFHQTIKRKGPSKWNRNNNGGKHRKKNNSPFRFRVHHTTRPPNRGWPKPGSISEPAPGAAAGGRSFPTSTTPARC